MTPSSMTLAERRSRSRSRSHSRSQSHHRRDAHAHSHHDHDKSERERQREFEERQRHRNRHPKTKAGRTGMYGSQFITYLATVEIRDTLFDCIMDTGSSDFAVAASSDCGCGNYYDGKCDGTYLYVEYGAGNWTGNACTDTVKLGQIELPHTTFAGMKTQSEMLDCENGHQQNGIIGMAYPSLLGPPVNYTLPLLDIFFEHTGAARVFAMQCCGWAKPAGVPTRAPLYGQPRLDPNDREVGDHLVDSELENVRLGKKNHAEYASAQAFNTSSFVQGSLDLGGVNPKHFSGHFWWTPISQEEYYSVEMLDVRVGNVSVMPRYHVPRNHRRAAIVASALEFEPDLPITTRMIDGAFEPGSIELPMTIVDSGTSDLAFTPDLNARILAELKKWRPALSDAVWSGDECVPHSNTLSHEWPELVITLAGERDRPPFNVIVPWCRYLSTAPEEDCDGMIGGHAYSIDPMDTMEDGNILGQVFMEEYYTVHDVDRKLVGIAPIDGCPFTHECRARPIHRYQSPTLLAQLYYAVESPSSSSSLLPASGLSEVTVRLLMLFSLLAIMLFVSVVIPIVCGNGNRYHCRKQRRDYETIE